MSGQGCGCRVEQDHSPSGVPLSGTQRIVYCKVHAGKIENTQDCGCMIVRVGLDIDYEIAFCPLHQHAGQLRKLVEDAVETATEFETEWNKEARAVLAATHGQEEAHE